MTSTVIANDLRPHYAKTGVRLLSDSAGHSILERGPSAARVEFVVYFIQRRIASSAFIDAGVGVVLIVCARAGHLSALLSEDTKLLFEDVSKCARMQRLE